MTALVAAAVALLGAPVHAQDKAPSVLDALNDLQEGSVPALADVQAVFDSTYSTLCPKYPDGPSEDPQTFDVRFRYSYDDATQPDRLLALYQFFCFAGVYNPSYVFFSWDAEEGLQPVGLAWPRLDVQYPGDGYDQTTVTSMAITAYASVTVIPNATFDPATATISSYSSWRGLGDASSGGTWVFHNGEFALHSFFVDPTYDDEMNPRTIIDFSKPQLVK